MKPSTQSLKALSDRHKPLAGRRILVTRAASQADGLRESLSKLGAEVIQIPTIEISPPASFASLDRAIREILEYDWLILTSVNGVEFFFERVAKQSLLPEHLQHLKIAAIGPATAAATEAHGLLVDVVPEQYLAEHVVRAIEKQVRGERILLARAKVARDVIPVELRAAGAKVEVVDAYETTIPADSKGKLVKVITDPKRRPQIITFTSSSTASNFLALIVGTEVPKHLAEVKFASIGPITSTTLKEFGLPVAIEAAEYTINGLVEAIVSHFQRG